MELFNEMKADSSEDEKSERQGDNKISEVLRGGEECDWKDCREGYK